MTRSALKRPVLKRRTTRAPDAVNPQTGPIIDKARSAGKVLNVILEEAVAEFGQGRAGAVNGCLRDARREVRELSRLLNLPALKLPPD